jgi:hypothetical protein
MNALLERLRILGSEIVLGTLIAVLSVGTAYASFQGAMADSEQNKYEIEGMKALNDGNTEYLSVNQDLTQDFTYFDNWYTNLETNPDVAEYYFDSMSDELAALVEKMVNGEEMTEADWGAYEDGIFATAYLYFDHSDAAFQLASAYDEKGDQLQLVVLFMALGLAFAAWASLLKEESNLRPIFALLAIVTLVMGVVTYLGIPAIPVIEIPEIPMVE